MLEPIRTVQAHERANAVATIVLAFSSDPATRWAYPEPGAYLEHMPKLVEALAGKAFAEGTAFVVEGFRGGALWLPQGIESDREVVEKLLLESTHSKIHGDVRSILDQMEGFHIPEPHWYLPLIGVEPHHHGKGLGSALMAHALAICDPDGMPAYLESSNPRNISLYLRHGFEVIGEIQSGSSPIWTPMVRPAREA